MGDHYGPDLAAAAGWPASRDRQAGVMNAGLLRTGYLWRQLPKDFPPRSTVYNNFWEWRGKPNRCDHLCRL